MEDKEHENMPEWAEDDTRSYWEASDEHERANGRLYREVQFALPKELDEAERAAELSREPNVHLDPQAYRAGDLCEAETRHAPTIIPGGSVADRQIDLPHSKRESTKPSKPSAAPGRSAESATGSAVDGRVVRQNETVAVIEIVRGAPSHAAFSVMADRYALSSRLFATIENSIDRSRSLNDSPEKLA